MAPVASPLCRKALTCHLAALFVAALLQPCGAAGSRDLRKFSGAPTRVTWVQDQGDGRDTFARGRNLMLMGFDSEQRRGTFAVVDRRGHFCAPVFTPNGRHVMVSDVHAFKTSIVSWDKGTVRDFAPGLVLDTHRDPRTGIPWAYLGTRRGRGKGETVAEIRRFRIGDPGTSELVWNQAPVSADGFLVSRSGRAASGLFPWPNGGLALLPNRSFRQLARGCWTSLAPDNSHLFWIFDGAHRNLSLHSPNGRNWKMPINTAPGINGFEVYHPRWSNHVRYMAMSGPYTVGGGGNKIRSGGKGVEIHVGRFSEDMSTVANWFRVTHNTKGDFYPDVWIASGDRSVVPPAVARQAVPAAVVEEDLDTLSRWPGSTRGLVFLWENAKSSNQVREPDSGRVLRTCKVHAHDRAVYGPYYDMRFASGSMRADGVDDDLLAACRHSHELTIQGVITVADVTQGGPARIISFSSDPSRRNVTLGQEKDWLVLRLRTPRTGPNGVTPEVPLCKLEAGTTYHVIATYRPGQLVCYINGKDVLTTTVVSGDFSNWEPSSLLFGNEHTGDRPWHGTLEGVAIYSRFMGAKEAARAYALYRTRLAKRKQPDRLVVEARLETPVATPEPADIAPYRRCLANYTYTVQKVIEGQCAADRIGVAHWVILDGRKLPESRRVGKTYRLVLEPMDAHPQLESERVMENDDFVLSIYYDTEL